MSGLTCEQLDELEERVEELLAGPWDKGFGRPRELTLNEALIVACGYGRNNITEEVWAEIFGVHQATISESVILPAWTTPPCWCPCCPRALTLAGPPADDLGSGDHRRPELLRTNRDLLRRPPPITSGGEPLYVNTPDLSIAIKQTFV